MERPFEKVEIGEERELEALIKKYPGQIEKGLKYLDHQLHVGRGFMDMLFVDPGGVLVVSELKIADDEGILMQAIKYYDVAYRDIDRISRQFPNKGIKIEEEPRITHKNTKHFLNILVGSSPCSRAHLRLPSGIKPK